MILLNLLFKPSLHLVGTLHPISCGRKFHSLTLHSWVSICGGQTFLLNLHQHTKSVCLKWPLRVALIPLNCIPPLISKSALSWHQFFCTVGFTLSPLCPLTARPYFSLFIPAFPNVFFSSPWLLLASPLPPSPTQIFSTSFSLNLHHLPPASAKLYLQQSLLNQHFKTPGTWQ